VKLAVLFWFYKEPDICQNRLEILRQYNPDVPIYGLYGGDLATVDIYKSQLDRYLDDFYAFPEAKDSQWKWLQGDLMITHWYRERGQCLDWDTVTIVQWDMLVFAPIDRLFSMLAPDTILLSGLRPIAEVENDWLWVTPKIPAHRHQYLNFLEYIDKTFDYQQEPMGCIFIIACLPRIFLEPYSQIDRPELGFIEYRIPIYAQILGIPVCENHPFSAWWVDNDPTFYNKNPWQRTLDLLDRRFNPHPLNPTRNDISLIAIHRQLNIPTGARMFHPYQYLFPFTTIQWIGALISEFKRDLDWLFNKIKNRH
jgi:hypothetical protein